jgi:hypothetical protein
MADRLNGYCMDSISLNTALGNCALDIKAELRNDKLQAIGDNAMAYLVWHKVPSSAYSKKSAFKRDSEYSAELEAHLVEHVKSVLGNCFQNIEIKASKYVKPEPKVLSADQILAGLDKLSDSDKAKLIAKLAPKTEQKSEAADEIAA